MATNVPASAAAESSPPFPSFEERSIPSDPVIVILETRRIRWTLNGPLESAVTISRDAHFDPDEIPEPYYLGSSSNNSDDDEKDRKPNWHPVSQLPLTEPKVSSLLLSVDSLDHWDYHWMEKHKQHSDLDEKRGSDIPDDELFYGPLPDEHLLVCCGEKRPVDKGVKGKVVIKPATGGGGFVTIHDFISTVHPYLMARRNEVLEAMSKDPGRERFSPEISPMVLWLSAPNVDVMDEAAWIKRQTRRSRNVSGKKLTQEEMNQRALRLVMETVGPSAS
ncbi:hypothetical protein N0V88_008102 [Collariella sp. IMI 366227]|nr:hypothetical protein N0V88_008102 [Collariella sp. IMI 366227]